MAASGESTSSESAINYALNGGDGDESGPKSEVGEGQ